jgi:hypothetical protein
VRCYQRLTHFVVLAIFVSVAVALYETIQRLIHPQDLTHLWVLAAAGAIGFAGNELAAQVRLHGDRRLASADDAPGVSGDLEDDEGDRETYDRVGAWDPSGDEDGGGDDAERNEVVDAGVVPVGDQGGACIPPERKRFVCYRTF